MPRHPIRGGLALGAILALAACGAAGISTSGSASGSATPGVPFFAFPGGATATVDRTLAGFPDEKFLNPGAVTIDANGTFHMFANAFTAWPGKVSFPHLTSTDGRTWMRAASSPAFTSDDVPFAHPGADVSTAFVTADGTWTLLFTSINFTDPWSIGRATAPGPDGPWTVAPEPVLTAGADGAWDDGGVAWPSVVATDDGFALYYAAGSTPRTPAGSIGLATSTDGVAWTKHDGPILTPSTKWEGGQLDRPRVQRTGAGYAMVYAGRTLSNRGLATSSDGVAWTRHGDGPVITAADFPINGKTWDTALLWDGTALRYYMEIGLGAGSTTTDVYLASHDGAPTP